MAAPAALDPGAPGLAQRCMQGREGHGTSGEGQGPRSARALGQPLLGSASGRPSPAGLQQPAGAREGARDRRRRRGRVSLPARGRTRPCARTVALVAAVTAAVTGQLASARQAEQAQDGAAQAAL
jgi:hypothetical protein